MVGRSGCVDVSEIGLSESHGRDGDEGRDQLPCLRAPDENIVADGRL